jgi:hypothetical protein
MMSRWQKTCRACESAAHGWGQVFFVKGENHKDERIGSATAIPFVSNDQFGPSYSCLRRRKVQ